jgi:hypothetical protein
MKTFECARLDEVLAAVRCLARMTENPDISLRISLFGEQCPRCRRMADTFIEPAGVCTACWTSFVINDVVDTLSKNLAALPSVPAKHQH